MSKLKAVESNQFDFTEIEEPTDIKTCPECNSTEIIHDPERAELICSSCGLVLMESMIATNHSGRRAYTSEEKDAREHTGAPLSSMLPNYGLSTKIDAKKTNRRFNRIKQWHTRLNWSQRNLLIATNEIRRLAAILGLPKPTQEESAILYRKVFKQQLLRGRSINSFVAACVYISCRLNGVPRTLNEVCKYSRSRAKTIRHSIHIIVRELNIKVRALNPTELISGFTNKLNLSSDVERRAIEIINFANEQNIVVGKDPKGIAAAAIYLASIETGERRSQTAISQATGVTEVTLRNRFKELKSIL